MTDFMYQWVSKYFKVEKLANTRQVLYSEDLESVTSQGFKKVEVGSIKAERRIDIRIWDQFGPTPQGISLPA